MKNLKFLIAGLFLAASLTVHAHGSRHGHHQNANYDTDGDGQVTADEILAARTAKFAEIDINPTDGYISFQEFQTWLNTKYADRFPTLDTDQNGLISLDEFLAGKRLKKQDFFTRVFNLANTTGPVIDPVTGTATGPDGLDPTEFAVLGPQINQMIYRFASLDADGDGQISQDEYIYAPGRRHRH